MLRRTIAISASSVAALIGVSALLTSPSACSCHSPAQVVANAAGLQPSWQEAAALDPHQIEIGLKANLVGEHLDPRSLFPSKEFGCLKSDSGATECFVPTHESWLLSKGWLVRLRISPNGAVKSAQVSSTWRALP